jgi:hypothetical protein
MAQTLIRDAARALSPDRTIVILARLGGCPRPTAKSWATGHRRPPIYVLKLLRELMRGRRTGLEGELDCEIRRREYEPKRLTGFCQIDPLTGVDKRNRQGRPRPPAPAKKKFTERVNAMASRASRATAATKLVPAVRSADRMAQACTICRHPERDNIEADLRADTPYRDIARRHNVSKDALSRHRANHMSRYAATGFTAVSEIKALLDKAETSGSWNSTLLAVREARRYVEELMMLNLTVPSSRVVAPDACAKQKDY